MRDYPISTRTLYKLTDEFCATFGGTFWELREWREASGKGNLCSRGWLHAYESPLVAVLMNPVHANFTAPLLFEAEGQGAFLDDNGLKCGVQWLRIMKQIPLPIITPKQRARVAIQCAKLVSKNKRWLAWACAWLAKKPHARTKKAVRNALILARRTAKDSTTDPELYAIRTIFFAQRSEQNEQNEQAAYAVHYSMRAAVRSEKGIRFNLHKIIEQAQRKERQK